MNALEDAGGGWVRTCRLAGLGEDSPVHADIGECPVCLVRTGGAVYALRDECTHESVPLSDGDVAGNCRDGLARVLREAAHQVTAVMCAETLWWRCHRRLIADAATIGTGTAVWHLGHQQRGGVPRSAVREVAQHVGEDAAVPVVGGLGGGVDPHGRGELADLARPGGGDRDQARHLPGPGQTADGIGPDRHPNRRDRQPGRCHKEPLCIVV